MTLPGTVDSNFGYALAGLPPGLSFDPATRVLSGTPTETDTTTATYTATGSHWNPSIVRTVAFDITVGEPLVLPSRSALNFASNRPASVTLPAATGGTAPYTYSLTRVGGGGLPPGLTFNASTRLLSAAVPDSEDWNEGSANFCTADMGVLCLFAAVAYTVTDDAGATVTREIQTNLFDYPPGFLPAPDGLDLAPGAAIAPVTLPQTADKAPAYAYALTGPNGADLSEAPGLAFDAATRVLSGSAPTRAGATTLTYTATHASFTPPLVHTATFAVTVAGPMLDAGVADRSYAADEAIAPLTLPTATGSGALTYALTGPNGADVGDAVPGLAFNAATRVLSGTPTRTGATTLTYTATDGRGNAVSAEFELTVTKLVPDAEVADRTYTVDEAIAPLTLPAVTGGTAPYAYALTGPAGAEVGEAVPGLSFDAATRVLSGTPTRAGAATLTYIVTDSAVPPARFTAPFDVTVTGPLSIAGDETGDRTYAAGAPVSLTLPAATGGTAPYTYVLSGPAGAEVGEAVPGLSFDAATRVLSGTPTRAGAATLTYTATDSEGNSASATFAVTVTGPKFDADVAVEAGGDRAAGASVSLTLPAATGGIPPYEYALTGPAGAEVGEAVPGLSFDAATRVLSGTPTRAGAATLTYTVTDSEGNSASATFAVTVTGPKFDAGVADRTFAVDEAIAPLTLPAATGSGALTYALAGPDGAEVGEAVPGLSFDPATRVLSGTPTEEGGTTLTYTATDGYGNATPATFAVTVTGLVPAALNEALLPVAARAMADSAVGAVARRIGRAARGAGAAALSLGGRDVWAALRAHGEAVGEGRRGLGELLSGSGFVLPLNAAGASGAPSVALWGSGEHRTLSGESGTLDWDGELVGVHLGVDARPRDDLLAGVAVSWLASDLDYEDAAAVADGGFGGGAHAVRMTGVHPYLGWRAGEGLDLWATAGYGEGELEVTPTGREKRTTDLGMRTVGVGGSGVLLERGTSAVRLKGEVMHSTVEVDDSVHVEGLEVEATRVRLTVEAGRTHTLADGGVLEPSLEAGVRQDGGDGETGNGAEIGGRLGYRHPSGRVTAEGRMRALVAAHDGAREEWGVEGRLRVSPGAGGRGLSLSLRPGYGDSGEGGVERLWRQGAPKDGGGRAGDGEARLETRLGYGLFLRGHAGVFTPYAEMAVGATDGYRVGVSWKAGSRIDLDLAGGRREPGGGPAGLALALRGKVRF